MEDFSGTLFKIFKTMGFESFHQNSLLHGGSIGGMC